MDRDHIERLFQQITVWQRRGQRAPHKPLLLLYALGKYGLGRPRLLPYTEIDTDLRRLLIAFGPYRQVHHPEFPFWRLQNDGLWEVRVPDTVRERAHKGQARKTDLVEYNAQGGLLTPIYDIVAADPVFTMHLAHVLLRAHFPATIHEDIIAAVDLDQLAYDVTETVTRRRRDRAFRQRVLSAYDYKCAVCQYDIRLYSTPIGLEAAHIMWHQAGGPDTEQNGLTLCALHHKLFDSGAFTISDHLTVTLSDLAKGTHRFHDYLAVFNGRDLHPPHDPVLVPEPAYLRWHRKQVFKGHPRAMFDEPTGFHVAESPPR